MRRTISALIAAAAISAFAAPAWAQTDLEISASSQWLSDRGMFKSNYYVTNKSDEALGAGAVISVQVTAPRRQKAVYIATLPTCLPNDCNSQQAAAQADGSWKCDPPYDANQNPAASLAWPKPETMTCHYALAADFAKGARTKLLHVIVDGGHPAEMCAAISAPDDADPANNETCYRHPAADYDLKVSLSPSTGVSAGRRWHTWRAFVVNKGPTAVPVEPALDGVAGFTYRAALPETIKIEELQIYGGWTCHVEDQIGVKLIGPYAAALHAAVTTIKQGLTAPAGGATIVCAYSTPYEFGAGAELAADQFSAGPVYVTSGWPAGVALHCGEIVSLNAKYKEKAEKLNDNTACWDIATNKAAPKP